MAEDKKPLNGYVKILFEILVVGVLGGLIAWGAATTTLDSIKTQVKSNTEWRQSHSVDQAKFEGKVDENLVSIKDLLKEIRDEQKEIRKELVKKADKK